MPVGFRAPELLLVIPVAVAVGCTLLSRWEVRRKALLSLIGGGSSDERAKIRIIVPLILVLVGLVALARPYTGYRDIEVPSVGGDVMVVLDVSLSMQAADAAPARIEAAKRKVLDLIDWVRLHHSGTRIGITLFAGSAHLYCPLTADYDVIRQFAHAINSSFITRGGSGLASALREAIRVLDEAGSPSPLILLLSDGEDASFNEGRISTTSAKGTPVVLALGFGSTEGVPIPVDQGRFLRDKRGNIVISRRNDAHLGRIAEAFRGRYQSALPTDDDFAPFLTEKLARPLSSSAITPRNDTPTQSIRVYDEVGPFLCLTALVALIVFVMIGQHRAFFMALLCLCSIAARAEERASEQEPRTEDSVDLTAREAYRAYLGEEYESAARGFRAARKKDPTNLDLLQGEASAAFRLKQFDRAERLFSELERKTSRPTQRFEARYNRGNALLAAQRYEKAIQSYDEALSLRPRDTPATANRELARQLLLQQQQQPQQQRKDKKQEKTEQPSDKNQSPQQSEQSEKQSSQQNEQESTKDHDSGEKDDQNEGRSDQTSSDDRKSAPDDSSPDSPDEGSPSQDSPSRSSEQSSLSSPSGPDAKSSPSAEGTPEGSLPSDEEDQSTPEQKPDENREGGERKPDQGQPTPSSDSDKGDSSSSSSAEDSSEESSNETAGGSAQSERQEALPATEAERWLASLPEAPVLLRRFQKNDQPPSEQQW